MTTCKGTAIVDVVMYGTDGGVLSTAKFYLNVDDGAVSEDDIKSSNEYESLTDALRTVGLAKEVANTALNTANEAVKSKYGYAADTGVRIQSGSSSNQSRSG